MKKIIFLCLIFMFVSFDKSSAVLINNINLVGQVATEGFVPATKGTFIGTSYIGTYELESMGSGLWRIFDRYIDISSRSHSPSGPVAEIVLSYPSNQNSDCPCFNQNSNCTDTSCYVNSLLSTGPILADSERFITFSGTYTAAGCINRVNGTYNVKIYVNYYTSAPGACGTANGTYSYDAPTSGFCSAGTKSGWADYSAAPNYYWTWYCQAPGGNSPSCYTYKKQNGVCGSANGVPSNVRPTENLCSIGTASSMMGGNITIPNNYWNWSCSGINSGTIALCSAPYPGRCGSANNVGTSTAPPITSQCSQGFVSAFNGTGPWTWTCMGYAKNPQIPSFENCSAPILRPPTVTNLSNTHNYCNESSYENLLWTYVDTSTPKSPQVGYDLQVSMDDDFPNDNLQINILKPSAPHPGSSFYQATVALGAGGSGVLSPDTTYYWHVKVYSSNGESAWSDTQNFTTPPNAYPEVTASIISPSTSAIYINKPVTFSADALSGKNDLTPNFTYAWTDALDGSGTVLGSNKTYTTTFSKMGSKTMKVKVCEDGLCCTVSVPANVRNRQPLPSWLEVSPL